MTKYVERDDALLVALYYRNPPGRVLRRKWSAEWKTLPNLENWIAFFKGSEANMRNEQFYDIDYQRIGNLHERAKVMYPTDNSLIVATKYSVGEREHLRYKVIKEGVVFGLQDAHDGLTVFWACFDEGVSLTAALDVPAEAESPAPPRASFNLTLRSGLVLRFMPTGDVVQKYVEGTQRNARPATSSLLHLYDNAEVNHESELSRTVTGQGSVVKYMKDGSVVVLYANGNFSVQTRNGTIVTTNNKGLRKARQLRDGREWAMDPVPCAIKTDPESGALVYIRDDQTMVIKYKDGS